MKKIYYVICGLMLMTLGLTGCLEEDLSKGQKATQAGYWAYRYTRTANQPLTNTLFMAHLSMDYFKLSTDAERAAFWKDRSLNVTMKEVKDEGGTKKWSISCKESDYVFDDYVFTLTPSGMLNAQVFNAYYSDEYRSTSTFKANVNGGDKWQISDYVITVKQDNINRSGDFNFFDGGAKHLDVTWTKGEFMDLYCDLSGTIQIKSHETPALEIEMTTKEPLRASFVQKNWQYRPFAWFKGTLQLTVTDGETKQTDQVGVILPGNISGKVLIQMNKYAEEW